MFLNFFVTILSKSAEKLPKMLADSGLGHNLVNVFWCCSEPVWLYVESKMWCLAMFKLIFSIKKIRMETMK